MVFRRTRDPKVEELRGLSLFEDCSPKQLERLGALMDLVELPAGRVLMSEGTGGRECFLITRGKVTVSLDDEELARLGPDEIVGEMALLDNESRSATVIAETPLRALVIDRQRFTTILTLWPGFGQKLLEVLTRRLRAVQSLA